jgi:hypothetical protein
MERTEESRKLNLMTRLTTSFQRTEESRKNFMMQLTPQQQYELYSHIQQQQAIRRVTNGNFNEE